MCRDLAWSPVARPCTVEQVAVAIHLCVASTCFSWFLWCTCVVAVVLGQRSRISFVSGQFALHQAQPQVPFTLAHTVAHTCAVGWLVGDAQRAQHRSDNSQQVKHTCALSLRRRSWLFTRLVGCCLGDRHLVSMGWKQSFELECRTASRTIGNS